MINNLQKRITLLTFLSLLHISLVCQDENDLENVTGSELHINILDPFMDQEVEVTYEALLSKQMSFTISGMIDFRPKSTFSRSRSAHIRPSIRFYVDENKKASGFFLEGFFIMVQSKYRVFDDRQVYRWKYTSGSSDWMRGFGVNLGVKLVRFDKNVLVLSAGFGVPLVKNELNKRAIADSRISFGYRFQ